MNAITDRVELKTNFLNFLKDAKNENTQNVLTNNKRLAVIFSFKITHTLCLVSISIHVTLRHEIQQNVYNCLQFTFEGGNGNKSWVNEAL
jgi:hypothetical protein